MQPEALTTTDLFEIDDLLLLETLDHLLNRGMVLTGEIVISVADVDLLYLRLHLLIASAETVDRTLPRRRDAGA